ncbi:unnamed protein product [Effrenium voratum]|nr:unnamed protein product [Effrenium voratum]
MSRCGFPRCWHDRHFAVLMPAMKIRHKLIWAAMLAELTQAATFGNHLGKTQPSQHALSSGILDLPCIRLEVWAVLALDAGTTWKPCLLKTVPARVGVGQFGWLWALGRQSRALSEEGPGPCILGLLPITQIDSLACRRSCAGPVVP